MLVGFVGYILLRNTITKNHEKDVEILVLDISNKTDKLLSVLLHQYSIQEEILIKKHQAVASYLNSNSYDSDLETIKKLINEGHKNSPYDIYITDEKFVIRNTTYKPDLGFDLSFAKIVFDEHYDKKIIGCSTPLLEKSSKMFRSYSDSYYSKDGNPKAGILQVSYTYMDNSMDIFFDLKKRLAFYENVRDAKAYIFVNDGHTSDLPLKEFQAYKPDMDTLQYLLKDAEELREKLKKSDLINQTFERDGTEYRAIYVSSNSAIDNEIKIIYSILLDESNYVNDIKKLNIWMIIITVLGIVAVLIIDKLRKKETKLSEQDKFVQSSMHEIKTPLSVITLNNELRELEFGKDEYSSEIDSAIKLLKTSYDDMSFTITKDKLDYPSEILNLGEVISNRVEYFKTIARSNSKSITLTINSRCKVKISQVELTRLIDNNLSNAIKYSDINTTIDIILKNDTLSFHNIGKPIKDTKHIFDKYFRENSVVGGHGLGLSIVKEIAKKYFIEVTLDTDKKNGTTFTYKFKCHSDDISQ